MGNNPHWVHTRKVEFSETDMAGIVHFSNFYRWMEAAEVEWFESLGHTMITTIGNSAHGWPRVRTHCDFHAPACFRDQIEVRLAVKELKIRAIEYRFHFYRKSPGKETHLATGGMTTVFARRDPTTGEMASATIPESLVSAINALLGEA
ncbi:MAG: acyl-CoA thioesterase [Puniceicoccales bacterium]